MPNLQPRFVWYDLMTSDTEAAAAFYGAVMGWSTTQIGSPGQPYASFNVGDVGVCGLMPIPHEHQGMPACWTGYVWVDDVDAYAHKVLDLGSKIEKPPEDIPGVGRFAVVADLHGAVFILFKNNPGPERAEVPSNAPGHIGWHELMAGDGPQAMAFYNQLFGWTPAQALDMGELGVYQLFSTGGEPVGGIMTKTPDIARPFWQYYFNVPAMDAAVARLTEAGGKILMGPHQVPTGSWILQGTDPQGAGFALVAPVR
jgi:predicted enzyme related to lactoylglutathione lyase